MGQLEGKTAVVTGGATGIGYATAALFAAEGAHVYITGRRRDALKEAAARLGDRVTPVAGDVADPRDLDALYAAVAADGRRVDVVFANAGIVAMAPLSEATEEHVDALIAGNLKGVLFTVQKALPLMPDGGSVILNASTNASRGPEGVGVYSATKAAVRSLARTFANELRGRRIRVNVVSPGLTDTPGVEGLAPDPASAAAFASQVKSAMAAEVPLGRAATPDEVAKAVLFLASDQSSFTTGGELFVDGGINQI